VRFLPVGQEVKIKGRLQSRDYQKKINDTQVVTKTAYEVSVSKIMVIREEDNAADTQTIVDYDEGAAYEASL
jgi:hypothetical protein